jgi:hypothetical protein
MPGAISLDYTHAVRLATAAAIQCAAGVLGATSGKARDTLLHRILIPLNATAVVVTVTGLADTAGAAASLVLTGQTTSDTTYVFDAPLLNEFAAFTFTASIANLAWVFTRAYTGP